jgi:hypothetical protein
MTRRSARNRAWEAALLGIHAAGYLTAIFLVLPPVKAVAFIVVQQGVFGFYLGCSFAPNHKGMPVLAASDKTDFLPDRASLVPVHAAPEPAPLPILDRRILRRA